MAQLCNAIAAVVLLLAIQASYATCQSEYAMINSYLMQKLPDSEDIAANLAAANELLEAESKINPSSRFVRYLTMFTSLELLLGDSSQCDLTTYRAKYDNDLATLGRIHTRPIDVETDSRVERIVYAITWKHSAKCMDIYPAKYSEIAPTLNETMVRRVEAITDRIVNKHLYLEKSTKFSAPNAEKVYSQGISLNTVISRTFAIAALDALKSVASEQVMKSLERVDANHIKTVEQVFEEYIGEPCRYFEEKLGMLFEMNDFDSETLGWSDLLNYTHKYKDFYAARGRASVCVHILDEELSLKKDIERYLVDSQLEGF